MSDTDVSKELVQKAAEGDRAAFEELYRKTCRAVYYTCLGFVKNEQEAQDVMQDVYLTAFEQLDTLEDVGKFKPWLYRIAANKCINCLKKKQPILPGDEQLEDMETEENENFLPEEYALNAGKREIVLKIIQETCTDVLYQTILLHYFNELSIAEIAEIMECPEGTVKYRLNAARAKIKDGVLRYEKKSGDKLYSVAVIPFLTALFTAQMQGMQIPVLPLNFRDVLPKPTLTVSSAKTGGRIALKGLQLKIAAGVAVAAVVGGVAAAAVTINNQKADEASAGAQEESTLDVAGLENAEEMETLQEPGTDATEVNEETSQEGTETAMESDTDEGAAAKTEDEATIAGEDKLTEETATEEEIPEQTAEPEYTYTDMEATMYAKQSVNVRDLPSTDGTRLGGLSTNQEVAVTGQCNETGWYRFEYNGQTAYVSNNYVSDTKIEVAAVEPVAEQAAASGSSTAGNNSSSLEGLEQYPVYTWLDYGDWFLYIAPDGKGTNTSSEQVMIMMDAFDSRYPGREYNGDWHFLSDGTLVRAFTLQDPWPQGYIDFMRKYLRPDFVPYR